MTDRGPGLCVLALAAVVATGFSFSGPTKAVAADPVKPQVLCPAECEGQPLTAVVRQCRPVVNPYPGTRYAGVNLRQIRSTGVRCPVARHVARKAHYKALGLPVPVSGIRRFRWHGWSVTGDLRTASDSYVARRDGKRISWRF